MAESTQQEQQSRNLHALSNLSPEERADALIARYIEPHPGNPGIAEYRLRVEQNGYPVWAIVASLLHREDEKKIAREYESLVMPSKRCAPITSVTGKRLTRDSRQTAPTDGFSLLR